MKSVPCGNYFSEMKLNKICYFLEEGHEVEILINCIGHTRNNMCQDAYRDALTKKFGENLVIKKDEGYCSYSYRYRLKEVK